MPSASGRTNRTASSTGPLLPTVTPPAIASPTREKDKSKPATSPKPKPSNVRQPSLVNRVRAQRANGRRIEFAPEELSVVGRFQKWLRRIATASTGEPSDGLSGSESSTSVVQFLAGQQKREDADDGDWVVDEIVVNHEIDTADFHGSQRSASNTNQPRQSTTHQSDSAGSVHGMHLWDDDSGSQAGGVAFRMMSTVWAFFEPRFDDPEHEAEYQKQAWYAAKPVALWASLYLYINWIMYLILNKPTRPYDMWAFYGGLTLFTVPVPFLIVANWSRKHPVFFQILLVIASWYCGITELIQIQVCEFFIVASPAELCNHKDFLAQMYYTTAFPMLLMAICSKRIYNLVFQITCFVLQLVFIIPDQHLYARNVVSFAIFHLFLQYVNHSREMSDRRMFMLNSQLKVAYRAQQKAQIAESKASQAKRRFASYIFHEVRVPLNTAMLAYQNLQGSQAFTAAADQNQGVEVYALEASLTMMQQVLNDVLDLQKMDAGRFESSARPFALHRAIRALVSPIGVSAAAKQLHLDVQLDPSIDALPGVSVPGEGLWVVGDEIRLRQVLGNLASNAVKFSTPGGGPVKIVTKLLVSPTEDAYVQPHTTEKGDLAAAQRRIVIRLEVHDSGPGIRPSDLVDGRLFQPFVQTRVGKLSGKGSGLGLAIVRQIVHLSGGRLGVTSRKNQGAQFWVELVYSLATPAEVNAARAASALSPETPPPLAAPRPRLDASAKAMPVAGHSFASNTSTGSDFPPTLLPVDLAKTRAAQSTPDLHASLHPPDMPPLPKYESRERPPSIDVAERAPSPFHSQHLGTAPAKSPSAAKEEKEDPLTVLVVDDDPMTRTLMTRMLTKLGCVVESAQDGRQGLGILVGKDALNGLTTAVKGYSEYGHDERSASPDHVNPLLKVPPTTVPQDGGARRFDLVCLDNYMPVMTGEEAVKALRHAGRDDLVVGCTGTALSEDQATYLEAGADRVLAKPIMLKDLKAMLAIAQQRRTSNPHSSSQGPSG